jgi:NADH-quinone oxidoreductase subunit J
VLMTLHFWFAAAVALVATLLAVSRRNAVHGLIWLILSLLAVATAFLLLGAPFAAALEVMVYAGAIMVLFVFVVMMLNSQGAAEKTEAEWLPLGVWMGPGLLALALAADLVVAAWRGGPGPSAGGVAVGPQAVGAALFGPYVIGVELASLLLLAGLVAAFHLGRRQEPTKPGEDEG